jgi:hypothetical protein
LPMSTVTCCTMTGVCWSSSSCDSVARMDRGMP